jgi:hypothetical protein
MERWPWPRSCKTSGHGAEKGAVKGAAGCRPVRAPTRPGHARPSGGPNLGSPGAVPKTVIPLPVRPAAAGENRRKLMRFGPALGQWFGPRPLLAARRASPSKTAERSRIESFRYAAVTCAPLTTVVYRACHPAGSGGLEKRQRALNPLACTRQPDPNCS